MGLKPGDADPHVKVPELPQLCRPSEALSGEGIGCAIKSPSDGLPRKLPSLLQRMTEAQFELGLQMGPAHAGIACTVSDDGQIIANDPGRTAVRRELCESLKCNSAAHRFRKLGVVTAGESNDGLGNASREARR